MLPHPGRRRKYPYYKVQARDPVTLSWKDHRKEAFDDEAEARAYLASLPQGVAARVVEWNASGSNPLKNANDG
jgi:hypothetical protein